MAGRGTTFVLQTVLVLEECCNCHVPFGLTQEMQNALRSNKDTFYCPSGHPQSYTGESDAAAAKRLARELEREKEDRQRQLKVRDRWIDEEREAHKATKNQLTATKGVLTKTRKRVANGVCPCCSRSFAQLERHMASQHPGYAESTPEAVS